MRLCPVLLLHCLISDWNENRPLRLTDATELRAERASDDWGLIHKRGGEWAQTSNFEKITMGEVQLQGNCLKGSNHSQTPWEPIGARASSKAAAGGRGAPLGAHWFITCSPALLRGWDSLR